MTSPTTLNSPDTEHETEAATGANRAPRQFSIWVMMNAMFVVAILCCVFFALPTLMSVLVLSITTLLVMPVIVALLGYGSGRARAFAVGASPPLGILFFSITGLVGRDVFVYNMGGDGLQAKITFAVTLFVITASGFLGQAVRAKCLRGAAK